MDMRGSRSASVLTTGSPTMRTSTEPWSSSHAELSMSAASAPGWRSAHRQAVSPPAECPHRTTSVSQPRSERMAARARLISSS